MKTYNLQVKKALPFFTAIVEKFTGNSRILLIGDLFKSKFFINRQLTPVSDTESVPQDDCVFFTLTEENKDTLLGLLPRIGIRHRIHQIYIERGGNIVYISGDSFDKEMTSIFDAVEEEFIKNLLNDGVLWKYNISDLDEQKIQDSTKTIFEHYFNRIEYPK
jgi:hypothetical protein